MGGGRWQCLTEQSRMVGSVWGNARQGLGLGKVKGSLTAVGSISEERARGVVCVCVLVVQYGLKPQMKETSVVN